MRNAYTLVLLSLSAATPCVANAQTDGRSFFNLVSLEVSANAFGKRVAFELGLSLDLRGPRDDDGESLYLETAQQAECARQARDWARAAALWREGLIGNEMVPDHWTAYGEALYMDNRHKESIGAYERAIQLGADRPGDAAWNIARAYAHLSNRKQALRWVERSFDLGYPSRAAAREEPAFEKYRDDPQFREFVEAPDASKSKVTDARVRRTAYIHW